MKKLFYAIGLAAVGLALPSCNQEIVNDYNLSGQLSGVENNTAVYLSSPSEKGYENFDTAYVVDGKFEIGGQLEHSQVIYLKIDGSSKKNTLFVNKGDLLNISGDPASKEGLIIEGNADHAAHNQLTAFENAMRADAMSKYQEYSAAMAAGDSEKAAALEAILEKQMASYDSLYDLTLANSQASILAPYLIYNNLYKYKLAELKAVMAPLSGEAKTTVYYGKVNKRINVLKSVEPGNIAPDFTLNDIEGNAVTLSDMKGDVIILDFWSSACGPCRRENPNVLSIYNDYKDKGLKVISVTGDTRREAWIKAVEEDGMIWTQLSAIGEKENPAVSLYGVTTIPHIIVIDKDFKIIAKQIHGDELRETVAKQFEI